MTKSDALQIDRMRDDLAPINDHALQASLRAAKARLRHSDARGVREAPVLDLTRVEADFARVFGAR
jgi:hypothetical protein